jgi:thiamine-phosphate pyrophosphorylase
MSALALLRGLYAIVDPDQTNGRDPVAVTEAILRGGAAIVQLRAKSLGDDAHLALARRLAVMCRQAGVPFVLNDRADLAVLADADGVHLGQGDLSLADARAIIGTRFIGRSTHDLVQVDAESGADMLGFGPIFATGTKENADPVVGIEGLRQAVARTTLPVVAIGGITLARLPDVLSTGVPLVAAISAVTRADDVETSARALHRTIVEYVAP